MGSFNELMNHFFLFYVVFSVCEIAFSPSMTIVAHNSEKEIKMILPESRSPRKKRSREKEGREG